MSASVPALMYHDVVAEHDWDASGFPGAAAAHYKLEREDFQHQIERLRASGFDTILAGDVPASGRALMLTFDDGGSSARAVGDWLAERGLRGHFFVTTGRIDNPGFVTRSDIRALSALGHAIGSHSHSHPSNISRLPPQELAAEWTQSTATLAQVLGAPTTIASIPGGFYSDRVAGAAAGAGVRTLFTSEPVVRTWQHAGCTLVGRFAIWRSTSATTVLELAGGEGVARGRQWLAWSAKKPVKRWLGPLYAAVRGRILDDA